MSDYIAARKWTYDLVRAAVEAIEPRDRHIAIRSALADAQSSLVAVIGAEVHRVIEEGCWCESQDVECKHISEQIRLIKLNLP
jgi:hypothetical protein